MGDSYNKYFAVEMNIRFQIATNLNVYQILVKWILWHLFIVIWLC